MMQARYRVNGVSLIEALVALAVMAFGLMGVAGLQASLRLNADVARQRAEAVRIAQEAIEDARSFSILQAPAPAGKTAYDGLLATVPATTVTSLAGANTTYTLTRTLVVNAAQNYKTVTADVAWVDRVRFMDVGVENTRDGAASHHQFGAQVSVAMEIGFSEEFFA